MAAKQKPAPIEVTYKSQFAPKRRGMYNNALAGKGKLAMNMGLRPTVESKRAKFWEEYKEGLASLPPRENKVMFPLTEIVEELGEKYKLTARMCEFLVLRPSFSTDRECAFHLGLSPATVTAWGRPGAPNWTSVKSPPPDFRGAYRELFARQKRAAEDAMNALLYKAVARTDDLLDATKIIEGKSGERELPDHQMRAKGIEIVSRWGGKWSEANIHEENNVYVQTMDEFNKLIQSKRAAQNVVEGEVLELSSGN